MLQPAAFRFCSECKTMQPGSFPRLQDDLMPGHCLRIKSAFGDDALYKLTFTFTLLRELHWLPIQHIIEYKVAVLTFKSHSGYTAPTYLSRHIKAHVSERTLRSSAVPLLDKPFTRSPGQTSRDELFVVLRQLSGTRCQRQ